MRSEPDHSSRHWRNGLRALLVGCVLLFAAGADAQVDLSDAERMAGLLERTAYRPSADELERHYLAPGSGTLDAFAERRVGDATALAAATSMLRADYRRAVERCLPAARALESRIPALLTRLSTYVGEAVFPPVVFLFGAGRSAGTVQDGAVVLALEVVCRFDDGARAPEALLEEFLLHEAVHFHQLRAQRPGLADSLLRQAMIEGFADFVTGRLLGRLPAQERRRHAFGLANEVALWRAFRRDMDGMDLASWMYGPGRAGMPADLGYWIGKRICAAYVASMGDETAAVGDLLALVSPSRLLAVSGYPGSLTRSPSPASGGDPAF